MANRVGKLSLGRAYPPNRKARFFKFLRENRDIFAYKPYDMTSVPRELDEHKLHVDPAARPVKQTM
jgi:hypothetical protein